jgi:tetratricopeptide (TPR) repeat protein
MKRTYLILTLIFLSILTFGQKSPLPPKPPKQEKSSQKNNSNSYRMYGEQAKVVLPKFGIPISSSTDSSSIYYFKTVENKLIQLDSTITAEQIVSLTKFNISKNEIDPKLLDSLANKTYKLNEEKKYDEAIKTAQLILDKSLNNITGHKEIGLAYKRIGKDDLANKHFGMMVKIISSIFKYGDGTYEYPFLINNFFEGISIYEATFRCKPSKITLMLDKQDRLLGAYNGYSSAMDEILIRYSELTHWKSQLKKGDYIEEK